MFFFSNVNQFQVMKYAGNCRLFLNTIFEKKSRRPDDACWELEDFVVAVMCGTDFGGDVRHAGDVYRFMGETSVTPEIWQNWYEQFHAFLATGIKRWPVVEKQGENIVWTWFQNSRQMGDWVPLGQPCPITWKLVKRGDGKGFNKVRV